MAYACICHFFIEPSARPFPLGGFPPKILSRPAVYSKFSGFFLPRDSVASDERTPTLLRILVYAIRMAYRRSFIAK